MNTDGHRLTWWDLMSGERRVRGFDRRRLAKTFSFLSVFIGGSILNQDLYA